MLLCQAARSRTVAASRNLASTVCPALRAAAQVILKDPLMQKLSAPPD
jgi:hypothetical protein